MSADLQPDELDALQAEDTGPQPAVLVKHEGPVRTQSLPRKAAASRTRTIDTTMRKILSADHRRASATIVSIGQNVLIAFSGASASDPSTCALWPQNVPFTLTADAELYVGSATATTSVSIITEFWATGE
jgi:hypothetical protein